MCAPLNKVVHVLLGVWSVINRSSMGSVFKNLAFRDHSALNQYIIHYSTISEYIIANQIKYQQQTLRYIYMTECNLILDEKL